MYVTVTGFGVVFVSTSLTLPEPDAAAWLIPVMAARVQVNDDDATVPDGVYEKLTPLQIDAGLRVLLRFGVGFTVTVTICAGPAHPFAVVVKTYDTVLAVVVVLVRTSLIFPVPVAEAWLIPLTAVRLHVKVDPDVALEGI